MKINNSDLKAAFLFAAEKEFSDIPDEQSLDHVFSQNFVEWGEKLVTHRFPIKRMRLSTKRVIRAILIAAIIAALLVGTAMAFPAVREAVRKFFIRNDGNMQYIEFYANESMPTEADVPEETTAASIPGVKDEFTLQAGAEYSTDPTASQSGPPIPIEYRFPTYLPEGLHVESEVVNPFTISTVIRGPNGLKCDYCQMVLPTGGNFGASIGIGEALIHKEEIIAGIEMDTFRSDTLYVLIWHDEFYLYQLDVNADMPMEEIEKIITSIAPRDDLNGI